MAATGTSKTWLWRWQERFMAEGVEGLLRDTETRARHRFERGVEGGRRGSRRRRTTRWRRLGRLTQEPPPHKATHWTIRAMGRAVGLAASTVRSIWKSHGLSPHRWRQFKL